MPALVIEAIHACKRDSPQGNMSLRQGTLDVLLPSLLNGDLDVVIGRFDPALAHEPLRYRRLIEEPLAVVASVGHSLLRRRRITPAELREQPWVAPVRTSSQFPSFAELFGGLPLPDDLIECASPVATHSLLQDGRRVGLLAVSTLSQPWGHGLKRLPVEVRWQPGPMGLYTVEGRFVAPEVEAFCKHIVKLAINPRGGGTPKDPTPNTPTWNVSNTA